MADAVPAATVVVARDAPDGLEVLMLRRNSAHAFGGMWVFPGGRVDDEDRRPDDPDDDDGIAPARRAAVREAEEEAGLVVDPAVLVTFSHWTPPPQTPRRFNTWFFLAPAPAVADVVVDGAEIHDHQWLRPADALERRDAGEIELAPPTWVTLWTLSAASDVADAVEQARARQPKRFATRMVKAGDGMVAMWHGDAGYDDGDLERPGDRHRLLMRPDGWRFEFEESRS